jgi:hypothetical protein
VINLLKLYKLFIRANRNSHIDTFLEEAVNATIYAVELATALKYKKIQIGSHLLQPRRSWKEHT